MIKFNSKDNGNYYVSILVKDGYPTEKLKNIITNEHQLKVACYDDNELLIPIDYRLRKYSLNQFRNIIKSYCNAEVNHFAVDCELTNQREWNIA